MGVVVVVAVVLATVAATAYCVWLESRLLGVPSGLRRLARGLGDGPTAGDVAAADARYARALASTACSGSGSTRYVITGGCGLTGAAIARALLLRRRACASATPEIQIRLLDLRHRGAVGPR